MVRAGRDWLLAVKERTYSTPASYKLWTNLLHPLIPRNMPQADKNTGNDSNHTRYLPYRRPNVEIRVTTLITQANENM
jgi:hypothetical protein